MPMSIKLLSSLGIGLMPATKSVFTKIVCLEYDTMLVDILILNSILPIEKRKYSSDKEFADCF
jgi:hypothetical protein